MSKQITLSIMKTVLLSAIAIISLASCGTADSGCQIVDRYNGATFQGRDTIAATNMSMRVGDTVRVMSENMQLITVVKVANLNQCALAD